MAGHSKWANIKHKKGKMDAVKGKIFTRVTKEIISAVKQGGSDPKSNPKLRLALQKAKDANLPNDNIERNIKKATSKDQADYIEVTYELYGHGGVGLLVDIMTDNKNRTTAEVRNLLNKRGGSLAGAGSTAFMFTKKGYLEVEKSKSSEDAVMEVALEAGAEDVKTEGETYEIFTEPTAFEAVRTAFVAKKIDTVTAEITMVPTSTVKVEGSDAKNLLGLIELLEENEDIQHVHANFDISDEVMAQLSEE